MKTYRLGRITRAGMSLCVSPASWDAWHGSGRTVGIQHLSVNLHGADSFTPFATSDSPVAFNAVVRLHTGKACPAAGGRGGPGAEDVECLGGY